MNLLPGGDKSNSREEISRSLIERKVVHSSPSTIDLIIERLALRSEIENAKASLIRSVAENDSSAKIRILRDFILSVDLSIEEKLLQKNFIECLRKIIPETYMITKDRTNEDRTRCDIVISLKPGDLKESKYGRASCFFELKRPKGAGLQLETHKMQVLNYMQQLMSKHVSLEQLPFVLFNGTEFFVGLACWSDYTKFEIFLHEEKFDLFQR